MENKNNTLLSRTRKVYQRFYNENPAIRSPDAYDAIVKELGIDCPKELISLRTLVTKFKHENL